MKTPLAIWHYTDSFVNDYREPDFDDTAWEKICLPHTNIELPANCFDESLYQFISCYRTSFPWLEEYQGKRLFLDFEGVMIAAEIWVNGKKAGEHMGGYTPFSLEITELLHSGTNSIAVKVDSTERNDIPPHGGVTDYLTYGGIYREAFLRVEEECFIADLFPWGEKVLSGTPELGYECTIDGGNYRGGATLEITLMDREKSLVSLEEELTIDDQYILSQGMLTGLTNITLWDLEKPYLYRVRARLRIGKKESILDKTTGFRYGEFTPRGFFLNGKRITLQGLNRHQSWPYTGYAMPERAQKHDADILKDQLGCNIVRTSHYPQSRHFLDRCDEIGLLVFEELPGWQHLGDTKWKEEALEELQEMIITDRHRPSIILWGVRINESQDDHDFYRETNRLAFTLDDTRQRGGVRYIEKSEFLEDVYTMNDFFHRGNNAPLRKQRRVTGFFRKVPYLVTEFNGHMYPTKRFDNEQRLVEHALRHARVLNGVYKDKSISGGIGWCMSDYNTHRDFGSGDRVCYHGVLDMFREPKFAAALYGSQKDISQGTVFTVASLMSNGEKDAANRTPIYIFTNCQEVHLYENNTFISSWLPDRKNFPHLPHPPVVIEDLIGNKMEIIEGFSSFTSRLFKNVVKYGFLHGAENLKLRHKIAIGLVLLLNGLGPKDVRRLVSLYAESWGEKQRTYTFKGLVDGNVAAEKTFGNSNSLTLHLEADDKELHSFPWDTTRIVVSCRDGYGNSSPFLSDPVTLTITGPGKIIGPSSISLLGGSGAFWIKTGSGHGIVSISAEILGPGRHLIAETSVKVTLPE